MENLRNKINLKPVNNKKKIFKCILKPSYMPHKMFGNTLIVIHKHKHVLMLNKPAYIGMYVIVLIKVLMHEFHYDCIKNKYSKSKLLFTEIVSLIYKVKT